MAALWMLSVSLLLGAWVIDSFISPSQPPLLNFGHLVFFDPSKVHTPSTKEEILSIVYDALENGHHIRVLGSGHSRSAIALSEDVMVSLHKYRGIFKFDKAASQVTVKGGTTIGEVVRYLDERGLALPSLPAITDQTITGAISTATHGTGVEFGNLATMVTGLELVTGEGETLSLSEANHPIIFKAALVSMGLLGVITKVTLQCVPAFRLQESLEPLSLDDCIRQLPTLATSGHHVKLWTELYSGTCAVIRMNRTEQEVTGNGVMRILDMKWRLMEPFLFLSSWFQSQLPSIMRFIASYINIFPAYSLVDESYNMFVPTPYFPSNLQTEIAVDRSKCTDAFQLLRNMVLDNRIPVNLITEVRFVRSDDIWLSPSYQRDGCYLTLMLYNPSDKTVSSYFSAFYQELVRKNFTPRVHFGKYFDLEPHQLYDAYPRLPEFLKIRQELDPSGLFLNQLMRTTFGL